MSIFNTNRDLSIKRYSDIAPEPLFLCEEKKNFIKRIGNCKNFVFLKFGYKNKQKRRKKALLALVPVCIVAIFVGGFCLSIINCSATNQILNAEKPEVVDLKKDEVSNTEFLVINKSNIISKKDFAGEITGFNNIECNKNITDSLSKLLDAAEKEGHHMDLVSGYVKASVRNQIYSEKVSQFINQDGYTLARAEDAAEKFVRPYYEYETGLSVILTNKNLPHSEFINTDECKWLMRNCVEYGFVLRTPQAKEGKTGLNFDSTLYRYVGTENAKKMRTLNMCLEEYRRYLKVKG